MSSPTPEQLRFQGHPSRLALEELAFAGEDRAVDSANAAHVSACAGCSERVAKMVAGRSAFLATHPPHEMMSRVRQSRARGAFWRLLIAPLSVAVAAGLGAVVLTHSPAREVPEVAKAKGLPTLRLGLLRSRDGSLAEPVEREATFRPRDVIRFWIHAPADGYVLVANVDDDGVFTRYYPVAAGASAPVTAGEQVLPGAIELDASPRDERIFVLFSAAPLSEEVAREILAGSGKGEDVQVVSLRVQRERR